MPASSTSPSSIALSFLAFASSELAVRAKPPNTNVRAAATAASPIKIGVRGVIAAAVTPKMPAIITPRALKPLASIALLLASVSVASDAAAALLASVS